MLTPGHVNDRIQGSPDSPVVVVSHSTPKEHYSVTFTSAVSSVASHTQSSSASSSPIPNQKMSAPSVNLHSLAKYVEKGLTSHVSAWQTEALERQVSKSICVFVKVKSACAVSTCTCD